MLPGKSVEFMSTPFDVGERGSPGEARGGPSENSLRGDHQCPVAAEDGPHRPAHYHVHRHGHPGRGGSGLGVLAFGYLVMASGRHPGISAGLAGRPRLLQEKVTLLHCTTEYPAPFREVNLRAMETLARAFGLPVGYSDHTPGIAVAIAAAARGAAMVEKHFTLDKNLPGPDHQASLEPEELKAMVRSIRQVEAALGSGLKIPAAFRVKKPGYHAEEPGGDPHHSERRALFRRQFDQQTSGKRHLPLVLLGLDWQGSRKGLSTRRNYPVAGQ